MGRLTSTLVSVPEAGDARKLGQPKQNQHMKKNKTTKRLTKSVRKAVKRHSIATGVLTGAATAMALSGSGATRKVSEVVGNSVAGLLKAGGKKNQIVRTIRKATSDALLRAGRSLNPEPQAAVEPEVPTTDAKVSTTTRRSAAPRSAA